METLRTIILIECISGEKRRRIGFHQFFTVLFTNLTKTYILWILETSYNKKYS